jgi:hypothetical protein
MTAKPIAKLERVDLREAWLSEASDFTPWLAQADNLKILGDAIGIRLALEAQEKNVGPFRADLLCRDTDSGKWVLVENQLECTDHTHLGQLLTYAAGLEAVTVVWVAARFTDEHRGTLDWLNQITDERFSFFGLEIELWRIGQSPVAPKFNIISKPNDWTRSVSDSARHIADEALSDTQKQQQRYWSGLRELLLKRRGMVRPQRPPPSNWTVFGIGRANFHLTGVTNAREKWVGAELYMDSSDAKAHYGLLEQQRSAIESEFGAALDWQPLPDRKGARVALYLEANPADESDWPRQHEWLADTLERFHRVFQTRVKALNAADWQGSEPTTA